MPPVIQFFFVKQAVNRFMILQFARSGSRPNQWSLKIKLHSWDYLNILFLNDNGN